MKIASITSHDIREIMEIADECGLCFWSFEAYSAELVRTDSILLKSVDDENIITGFAAGRVSSFDVKERSAELLNIGVRQLIQHQGVGQQLLKCFINAAVQHGASSVILEVRRSNARAIDFYRKIGFSELGVRRRFYADPAEDAITMKLAGLRSFEQGLISDTNLG